MASTCPAFGMIGTLVGLVIMLDNMEDPSAIGPGLAVALITTLYGVLFSRLIFLPAALKIQQREEIGRFRNYLVTEGLSMLADRRGPRYIQDRMNSYLDPSIHFQIDQQINRGQD
jgi:chemotaxis protein MotA